MQMRLLLLQSSLLCTTLLPVDLTVGTYFQLAARPHSLSIQPAQYSVVVFFICVGGREPCEVTRPSSSVRGSAQRRISPGAQHRVRAGWRFIDSGFYDVLHSHSHTHTQKQTEAPCASPRGPEHPSNRPRPPVMRLAFVTALALALSLRVTAKPTSRPAPPSGTMRQLQALESGAGAWQPHAPETLGTIGGDSDARAQRAIGDHYQTAPCTESAFMADAAAPPYDTSAPLQMAIAPTAPGEGSGARALLSPSDPDVDASGPAAMTTSQRAAHLLLNLAISPRSHPKLALLSLTCVLLLLYRGVPHVSLLTGLGSMAASTGARAGAATSGAGASGLAEILAAGFSSIYNAATFTELA